MGVSPSPEWFELLGGIRAQLEFQRQTGTPGVLPVTVDPPETMVEAAVEVPADPSAAISTAAGVVKSTSAALPPAIAGDGPPAALAADLGADERLARLRVLAEEAATCKDCVLHERRKQAVFARGNPRAELVFVGEGPGRDEDARGEPFVGAAGQLLDKMIAAMGFRQDEIYICNVVKCRPPDNRTPRPEEALACARFLRPQLQLVAPKIIVALGRCAAEHLGVAQATGPWRGRWGRYQDTPVLPTYHPAFLLRSPQFKKVVWQDLQQVMARFGREPKRPTRGT